MIRPPDPAPAHVLIRGGLRGVRATLVALVALPLAYVAAACLGAAIPAPSGVRTDGPHLDPTVEIALIAGPIHYDILLPATEPTQRAFAFAQSGGVPVSAPATRWITVGWGSRAVYTTLGTWRDVSLPALWRGAVGDDAVMRIGAAGALPDDLRRIALPAPRYADLIADILADIRGVPGAVAWPDRGWQAAFFPARGRFNLGRTCNVWVAEKLARAGVPVGAWTPLPFALGLSLDWHGGGGG